MVVDFIHEIVVNLYQYLDKDFEGEAISSLVQEFLEEKSVYALERVFYCLEKVEEKKKNLDSKVLNLLKILSHLVKK